ncbi:MAG: TraR/DksA C4-type zinc finger protein [Pseudodesulfovibrio sp.]|uniref:Phage/conjugal plasmid C-4 type zinc finger protein, TraR family n=1 Tax=Pseudodesulfovibrio aespoeensis (strain ATCC 700646 / DSM 10631 / Aspo-2) TaxID=643562 RepID=E6VU80_PSEA9|nr:MULTISPECIES: TraR/DksA C4-type zinc finger protein [Pseudodesulfovibrio]MBU4378261.1 TraR/DksA C4-type zinc finger protein [Pseudomonadota bacterium]ADU63387.1 phage/conjugal plasmid C-4 type zinc finger protein, TraR family [Pseudodesulfovibrio aespoeensis Aspo-2]MBU4517245.1 TraR/DksA C4-type zinc finger protein [Pseudomonadota bacterium]MBU4520893.1 TraR/DksA C4-type zinc finger protein [Pseudomonadota bacterium]MBU4560107.1 TraR/DksA C4-type zinc finger protein [Pseudomonadota bacteriu
MADIVDMAQACEALERAAALANRDRRIGPGAPMVDGVAICHECGEPIAPARLIAIPGCNLCRDCQEEAEHI